MFGNIEITGSHIHKTIYGYARPNSLHRFRDIVNMQTHKYYLETLGIVLWVHGK